MQGLTCDEILIPVIPLGRHSLNGFRTSPPLLVGGVSGLALE